MIVRSMSIDLNALGQICDATWGRSSTPKTASYSVKFSLKGELLTVMYIAIVNFGTEKDMILTKRACADESIRVTNEAMKTLKAKYKEIADGALKATERSTSDSLEIINAMVHNPKRTAYYRRFTMFDIS